MFSDSEAGFITGCCYWIWVAQMIFFYRDVMRIERRNGGASIAIVISPSVMGSAIALVGLFFARLAMANWVSAGVRLGEVGRACSSSDGRVIMAVLLVASGFSLHFWRQR